VKFDRKSIAQLGLAALVAWLLVAAGPFTPAQRLSAAVNYKYHQIVANLASDGLP
jgi:hypothetical protein